MLNGYEIEAGDAGEIGTEARVLAVAEIEEAADARLAKVRIEEQGAVAELRQSDGEIRGRGGFALARQGAGDQNDLRRVIGLGEQQRGAQGAEGFRHLGLGQVLRD